MVIPGGHTRLPGRLGLAVRHSSDQGLPGLRTRREMDERAARKLSDLLGTTVSFPHHRARSGASDGFNRRAAAMPTSIRDRILREHDVDVRLHAWLAARDP